jgi:hypothetical protein
MGCGSANELTQLPENPRQFGDFVGAHVDEPAPTMSMPVSATATVETSVIGE